MTVKSSTPIAIMRLIAVCLHQRRNFTMPLTFLTNATRHSTIKAVYCR